MYTWPTVPLVFSTLAVTTGVVLGQDTNSSTPTSFTPPGQYPWRLNAASVTIRIAPATAPIVDVWVYTKIQDNTTRTLYCSFANPLADWVAGKCLYYDRSAAIIKPGGALHFVVRTTAATGRIYYGAMLEPLEEAYANNSQMLRSQ